jgi:hypothetical protein
MNQVRKEISVTGALINARAVGSSNSKPTRAPKRRQAFGRQTEERHAGRMITVFGSRRAALPDLFKGRCVHARVSAQTTGSFAFGRRPHVMKIISRVDK